jgi:sugar phosphate isomerase/epimerase
MNVSLSTHLFVFHDIDDGIASLFPRFGFSSTELWGMPPHFPYADRAASDGIAERLARFGVRILSVHAPLYPDVRTYKKDRWYSLSSDEDDHRRDSVAATASVGDWLAGRGGGTLVLHTSFPAGDWYPVRWGAFLSSLNELLPLVPENVRFAVENTPVSSGRVEILRDIVARYPPERVGICLDLGHAHIEEDPLKAIEVAGERLIHVHASDNHGNRDEHLVPGRGTIPWTRILSALREAGFAGAFTVELNDATRGDQPAYKDFEDILFECRNALDRYLPKDG